MKLRENSSKFFNYSVEIDGVLMSTDQLPSNWFYVCFAPAFSFVHQQVNSIIITELWHNEIEKGRSEMKIKCFCDNIHRILIIEFQKMVIIKNDSSIVCFVGGFFSSLASRTGESLMEFRGWVYPTRCKRNEMMQKSTTITHSLPHSFDVAYLNCFILTNIT